MFNQCNSLTYKLFLHCPPAASVMQVFTIYMTVPKLPSLWTPLWFILFALIPGNNFPRLF